VFEDTRRCCTARIGTARSNLTYPKHPIRIFDQKDDVTMKRKTIKFFKVQWRNHSEEEAMWESDDLLCYCHLDFELLQ
jgi:hypothetical protein